MIFSQALTPVQLRSGRVQMVVAPIGRTDDAFSPEAIAPSQALVWALQMSSQSLCDALNKELGKKLSPLCLISYAHC